MTEKESQGRGEAVSHEWLAIAAAFAGGMVLYAVVMPLLASVVLGLISPFCETVTALTALGIAVSRVLPAFVMLGIGLGAGFLWWRIPLRVGLAAGIGAAATSLLATLSLPLMAVNESRVIGECVIVMAAGLLGGFLARRLRADKKTEAPTEPDG